MMRAARVRSAGVDELLRGLVDYAGLFPPAGLGMAPAVANYARYLRGGESWMLARFIAPASRLGEFEAAAMPFWREHPSRGDTGLHPWHISALVGDNIVTRSQAMPGCAR